MSLINFVARQVGIAALATAALVGVNGSAQAMYAPGAIISSEYVLGPTSPGKWGPPAMGTGATVTWSLMATGTSCASEFVGCTISALSDFMPVGFMTAINAAFNAWSSVANITFVQVPDDGAAFNAATSSGDIRLGGHAMDGAGGTLAHGFYPPANGLTAAGDIHFDTGDAWKLGFGGPGFDLFQVMAHELGHAIGLHHTAVPGSLMNPFYSEAFSGPQADDIAGAQFIYGTAVTSEVPEPATFALLGLALAATVGARRRQAAASA